MGKSETDKTRTTQKAEQIIALVIAGKPALFGMNGPVRSVRPRCCALFFADYINGTREQLGDREKAN
jgi:hypothetical protein